MPRKVNTDVFISVARETHGDRYGYDKVIYIKKKLPVLIWCKKHKTYFSQQPGHHVNGSGCSKCALETNGSKRRITHEQFITRATQLHSGQYDYSKVKFSINRDKIVIICLTHGEFTQKVNNHLSGQGCPKCYGYPVRTNDSFIKESQELHGNKYGYDRVVYTNVDTYVSIYCKTHEQYFDQTPSAHIHQKQGCPLCGKKAMGETQSSDKKTFIAKANNIHHNKYDYKDVVYVNNKIPVEVICKKHTMFMVRPDNHLQGSGCPMCSESRGETKIRNLLDNLDVLYTRQYRLPGTNYRYDFCIPTAKILIEYDGIQHYQPVEIWGGVDQLNKQKETDANKNIAAELSGYILIRIPYLQFKNIEKNLIMGIYKYYKYYYEGIFYRTFKELCNGLKLPINTKREDVIQHLTHNINH